MWILKWLKKKPKKPAVDPIADINAELVALNVSVAALTRAYVQQQKTVFRLLGETANVKDATDEVGEELATEAESIREEVRAKRTIKAQLIIASPEWFRKELERMKMELLDVLSLGCPCSTR